MRRPSALHLAFLATAAFGVASAFVQACSYDWELPGDICDDREIAACAKEPIKKLCSGTSGCVQCLDNGPCAGSSKPVCNLAKFECAGCSTSQDCIERQSPAGNACDTSTGTCVECIDDEDCVDSASGAACTDDGAGRKICGCRTRSDCASSIFGQACDGTLCYCESPTDCEHPEATSAECSLSAAVCGCTEDGDCPTGSCADADCADPLDPKSCKPGRCTDDAGTGGASSTSTGAETGATGTGGT